MVLPELQQAGGVTDLGIGTETGEAIAVAILTLPHLAHVHVPVLDHRSINRRRSNKQSKLPWSLAPLRPSEAGRNPVAGQATRESVSSQRQ